MIDRRKHDILSRFDTMCSVTDGQTQISMPRHYLTLNISETVRDTDIVAMDY